MVSKTCKATLLFATVVGAVLNPSEALQHIEPDQVAYLQQVSAPLEALKDKDCGKITICDCPKGTRWCKTKSIEAKDLEKYLPNKKSHLGKCKTYHKPTPHPTNEPTTKPPTHQPTKKPHHHTNRPTPLSSHTKRPTSHHSHTKRPTSHHSHTKRPTHRHTKRPTQKPTQQTTEKPTHQPTKKPHHHTKRPTPHHSNTKRPTPHHSNTKRPTTVHYTGDCVQDVNFAFAGSETFDIMKKNILETMERLNISPEKIHVSTQVSALDVPDFRNVSHTPLMINETKRVGNRELAVESVSDNHPLKETPDYKMINQWLGPNFQEQSRFVGKEGKDTSVVFNIGDIASADDFDKSVQNYLKDYPEAKVFCVEPSFNATIPTSTTATTTSTTAGDFAQCDKIYQLNEDLLEKTADELAKDICKPKAAFA